MASLFRHKYTRPLPATAEIVTRKGKRFVRLIRKGKPAPFPLTKQGDAYLMPTGKWYGRVPGSLKPVPLSTNKVAAQQMLAELVRKAELEKAGIVNPFQGHQKRPLPEHLVDFECFLKSKGVKPKQVNLKIGRIRRLLDGCGFVFMADLSAARVQQFLADLRQSDRPLPELEPGKKSFTRKELALTIGVKPETVCSLVRRHGLEATGNGKARLFTRATAIALQERLGRGAGIQTANYYLREIKSFCRWLVKERRMADNPLDHLQGGNVKLDRRHDRRAPFRWPSCVRSFARPRAATGYSWG